MTPQDMNPEAMTAVSVKYRERDKRGEVEGYTSTVRFVLEAYHAWLTDNGYRIEKDVK